MKKVRNVIIWVIVSVIVQTGILYYFNNYYFGSTTKVVGKQIQNTTKKINNISVSIPKDAAQIQISQSGKYAYYYSQNQYYVANMLDGKINKIDLDVDSTNVGLCWLIDRDAIMILEKDGSQFQAYTYNPVTNSKELNRDANDEMQKYNLGYNLKFIDIKQNNISTHTFIKVATSKESLSRYIYRLDISNGLEKMDLPIHNIGDYYIFKPEDKLVYEDEIDKKVYVTYKNQETQPIHIDGVDQCKLLGIDNTNGYVYIGKLENGSITTIYYASLKSEDTTDSISSNNNIKSSNSIRKKKTTYSNDSFNPTWSEFNLSETVTPDNIYVSPYGDIYTIDNLKGVIKNEKTNKKVTYDGKYFGMSDDDVISFNQDTGKLIETKLN